MNAAFNEIDRHVLSGYGGACAIINDFDGMSQSCRYSDLFILSLKASLGLQRLGLVAGDRMILVLPTGLSGLYWIEAAKRLAIIYVCLPTNLPVQSVAD